MKRSSARLWASSPLAQVTDPDLDAHHPGGTGGEGKYAAGWIPEKEPHQWINFIYGAQDEILYQGMAVGGMPRDPTINYKSGAISLDNEVWKTATKDTPAPNDWEEVAAGNSLASFTSWETSTANTLNAHKSIMGPTGNAHDTTIAQAGGYDKQEADVKSTAINVGIEAHKSRTDNPHNVSHTQVNCLPASLGGNFTGIVNFKKVLLTPDSGLQETEVFNNRNGLGIKDVPWLSASNEEVLTQKSYTRLRNKHEPKFALPPEDIFIPLADYLTSPSSGAYTLEYARNSELPFIDRAGVNQVAPIDEPPFELMGLKLSTDYSLIFVGGLSGVGTLSYDLNGVVTTLTVDFIENDLSFYIGKVGNAKNLRIWLTPLTEEQKAMLGGA